MSSHDDYNEPAIKTLDAMIGNIGLNEFCRHLSRVLTMQAIGGAFDDSEIATAAALNRVCELAMLDYWTLEDATPSSTARRHFDSDVVQYLAANQGLVVLPMRWDATAPEEIVESVSKRLRSPACTLIGGIGGDADGLSIYWFSPVVAEEVGQK
jgi:hypothetical protein